MISGAPVMFVPPPSPRMAILSMSICREGTMFSSSSGCIAKRIRAIR